MNDALQGMTREYVVTRPSAGVTYEKGRAVQAGTTTFTIEASIQPLKPNELQTLPEAQRTSETMKVYTDAELRPASQASKVGADQISYRGELWQVVAVATHDEEALDLDLDHRKVYIQRIGKG